MKDLNRLLREAKRHPAFAGYDRVARARAIWTRNLRHPEGMVGAACADPRIALIQVNAALRSSRVPDFVVEFLVFHELAHLAEPPIPAQWGGSPGGHSPDFYAIEDGHPDKEAAEAWLRANLERAVPSAGFGLIRRVA